MPEGEFAADYHSQAEMGSVDISIVIQVGAECAAASATHENRRIGKTADWNHTSQQRDRCSSLLEWFSSLPSCFVCKSRIVPPHPRRLVDFHSK